MRIRSQLTRLFSVLAFVGLPTGLAAQGNFGCASATDRLVSIYRDSYGRMVSRTDPASVAQRARLGLPTLADNQVLIVSDTTKCRIASAAYDSVFHFPAPTERPLVLQLNTQYVVVKGLADHGGKANVLFNQDFTVVQTKIWH
jgi:hypothetical protein